MINVRDIISTEHILEASEKDSLSKALAKLPTSHSAAFIFSKDKKKVGLVNPYHCIIRSSLPGNAKVEACVFHSPKLYITTRLDRIIESFISSKIHYLPVFNQNETFAGVVSARGVLNLLKDAAYFNLPIKSVLKRKFKPLVTIQENDTISTAIHLFKLHRVSKLIVVNKDNKLKGVLSYFDIVNFLLTPKHKLRPGDKEGKKGTFYSQKVTTFSKSFVLTLTSEKRMHDALEMVLTKKIGSVIVVDAQKHPIGIITTRDFFNLVLRPSVGLQVYLFQKNLSKSSSEIVQGFYASLQALLRNKNDISKAQLTVKEEKQGNLFKVFFSQSHKKGKQEVIKSEGRNLKLVLQDVKNNLRGLYAKKHTAKR